MAAERRPAVSVRDLQYRYPGGAHALRGVDLLIGSGQVVGFVGASGAGKTTLLRVLIGLITDFRGAVDVLGKPVQSWGPSLYERIGVAFELPTHYRKLTGRENLDFFASLQRRPTVPVDALLQAVGLDAAGDERVATYSKGMAVRLGLARALLADPELLVLDEPTSGLDPASARRVADIITSRRDRGCSVLLSTHDLWLAEQVCGQLVVIVDGRVVATDSPGELGSARGGPTIRVTTGNGSEQQTHVFGLREAAHNPEFLAVLRRPDVRDIMTERSRLGEVLTGLAERQTGSGNDRNQPVIRS